MSEIDELRAKMQELKAKIARQKHDAHYKDEALAARTRELDALGRVWCSGGCRGGMYRFREEGTEPTAEQVAFLLRNAYRALAWYINRGRIDATDPSNFECLKPEWAKRELAVLAALAKSEPDTIEALEADDDPRDWIRDTLREMAQRSSEFAADLRALGDRLKARRDEDPR